MRMLWVAAVLLTPPLLAEVQPLEQVAAVVDESIILVSEVDGRVDEVLRGLLKDKRPLPPREVIEEQVLERLIIERIQLDRAERAGIRVDDASLNEALTGIARQNDFSTLDAFAAAVRADGIDWARFREDIRRDLIMNQLRQQRVSRRIRITDGELERFMSSGLAQQLFSAEFHLGHILIATAEGASLEERRTAETLATDIVRQARSGADFADLAVRHSASQTALDGGDLGWRPAAEWPSLFSDAAMSLQAGDISDPIRASNGFHILKMIDRRGDAVQLVTQYQTRHLLIQPDPLLDDKDARALADTLRARIMAGEEMAALAREFSDDPGSASNGGDLGWVTPGEMVQEFDDRMTNLPVGQLSTPFRSEFGWHILRVEDTRTTDMSDQFRKLRARQVLHQRRFAEELEIWLAELRQDAYVEIRL